MRPLSLSASLVLAAAWAGAAPGGVAAQSAGTRQQGSSPSEVLAASTDADWRSPDPARTVYFELAGGRVVVELAPRFAPNQVANIEALVRAGMFDGGHVVRSQDNYVAQWTVRDPAGGTEPPALVATPLPGEFEIPAAGSPFTPLPDPDTYAPEVGFVDGFPVARDPASGVTWVVHCYGMVAEARGNDPDSGNGSQLYAVIGQAPRHLDRSATMVGRVVSGMEHLSTLPRGTGSLGFYETPGERAPIARAVMASDVPAADRSAVQILRTDTPTFQAYVAAERFRTEAWFQHQAGRIDVCNLRLPTRATPTGR